MRSVSLTAVLACGLVLAGGSSAGHAKVAPCASGIHKAVLPTWARSGFSDERPVMPYALGASTRMAAIVFGYPLLAPPSAVRGNKILWVSHSATRPLSDLVIRAQRMIGTTPIGPVVLRTVRYGPGPSIIDLPSAGCWRLGLSWSGKHDTLDLTYLHR